MPVYHFTGDIENCFRQCLPEEYAFQVTLEGVKQLRDHCTGNVAASLATS